MINTIKSFSRGFPSTPDNYIYHLPFCFNFRAAWNMCSFNEEAALMFSNNVFAEKLDGSCIPS